MKPNKISVAISDTGLVCVIKHYKWYQRLWRMLKLQDTIDVTIYKPKKEYTNSEIHKLRPALLVMPGLMSNEDAVVLINSIRKNTISKIEDIETSPFYVKTENPFDLLQFIV